ncbi:MAG: ATP-grasp domain-containing protein [Candidatus Shapirobacteria bacterium]
MSKTRLQPINQPIFWAGVDYFYSWGFVSLAQSGLLANFHLICLEEHDFLDEWRRQGIDIFCLEKEEKKLKNFPRNTGHLLSCPKVWQFIKKKSEGEQPAIAFFKPSPKIDWMANNKGWKLLGNNSRISRSLENKTSFFKEASKFNWPVFSGEIIQYDLFGFSRLANAWGLPFVAQTSYGWAGKSTYLIKSKKDWLKLGDKKGAEVKISRYYSGPTLINNACVLKNGVVLVSPLARQINGFNFLSKNPFSSCGRVWTKEKNKQLEKEAYLLSKKVGTELYKKGYRGFFGLDFLFAEGKLYLLEINPRFTSSFVFYHFLEKEQDLVSLLEWHVLSFLDLKEKEEIITNPNGHSFSGAELIQRNIWGGKLKLTELLKTQKLPKLCPSFPKRGDYNIFYPSLGKEIKCEDECFRVSTRESIIGQKGEIRRKILEIRNSFFKNG